MPSDGCGADLSFAQCYGNGQWDPFFGGSFGWNDGWGHDPNPGQNIIQGTEHAFDIVWQRGHWGREGHLRGWNSDFYYPVWLGFYLQNTDDEQAANTVANGVDAALQVLQKGCWSDAWNQDIKPGNRYFANVDNPNKYTQGWSGSCHRRERIAVPSISHNPSC